MLVKGSMQIIGQLSTKVNKITRSCSLETKQGQQLRLKCHRSQKPHQMQYERNYNYQIPLIHCPPVKPILNKKNLKGSVCLLLLPVSTLSYATIPNISIVPSVTFSSSSFTKSLGSTNMAGEDYKNAKSIYDFTVKDTHGNDVSLEKYKGHVLLIVNIASQCGLTKNNYKKLTDLKEKYHDKGLRILNFPCNQFGSQMPEQDGEAMVCHLRDAKADIGDVFQKIEVNGSGAAPLYQYLKAKQGGTLGSAIKWNFTKFLINKEGIPVNRYAPTTDPMDIAKDIEKLL